MQKGHLSVTEIILADPEFHESVRPNSFKIRIPQVSFFLLISNTVSVKI